MISTLVSIPVPVLGDDPGLSGNIVHVKVLPPVEPVWSGLPGDLDDRLVAALAGRGITRLYAHQAEAYALARAGKDFVVVTPTASGKTLCYNLPVVQSLLEDPAARALYLFPTKALSQDQQAELNALVERGSIPAPVFTYDGDTPGSLRTAARDSGRIVITNPDMLHSGILPNHPKWIRFFSGLRYIVVDEMHVYRGVFGSHVANVLRRVRRIARFYGSDPVFVLCSATIGNPVELASALCGKTVRGVTGNGAGRGERMVAFYNPPLVDPVQGIRKGTSTESQRIAIALLKAKVRTILFARSRVQVELIAGYISSSLANRYTDDGGLVVRPYRSGLLPSERRAIEKGLREGRIHGVVSTNALELGIDIGGLDAAVVAGFPGSIASFWQQSGRAGRRGKLSLAVLVASSSPVDQYMITHPEYFFDQTPECARINPENAYIFLDHVKCAAFELPFADGDSFDPSQGRGSDETSAALEYLAEAGIVRRTQGRWYWSAEGYPSEKISLRSATADNVVIIDVTDGSRSVIGEMDRASAKELLFDNAIYIHLGRQYMVLKLDIGNRVCEVESKITEYWTDAIVKTDLKVLTVDSREPVGKSDAPLCECVLGDVLVRTQAEKFKKLRFHTHENVGYGDIDLPPEEMQTRAFVLLLTDGTAAGRMLSAVDPATAAGLLGGLGRLLRDLATVFLLCDRHDLGTAERVRDPHFLAPAVFLFDRYPGGTGLAEGLGTIIGTIVTAASERLHSCACVSGCPSCIGVDPGTPTGAVEEINLKVFVAKLLEALASSDGESR